MSWDRWDYDEESLCACGKGKVIKHSYREDDDWNRAREGVTGVDILCPYCKSKYHYGSITRHYFCMPWDGDGISIKEYLVPNGFEIPKVITPQSYFGNNVKERIVCQVTKEELQAVIEDMKSNKYSTRVKMDKSNTIIGICEKGLNTKYLKKIIPILEEILASYEQYEWNPDTIAEYKRQEAERIKQNEKNITDVIAKSYKLDFHINGK